MQFRVKVEMSVGSRVDVRVVSGEVELAREIRGLDGQPLVPPKTPEYSE
jgi:hypothetical protein